MELFIGWIVLCIGVGIYGSSKKTGFSGGFWWSFFLSPLIGVIIVANSKSKKEVEESIRNKMEKEITDKIQTQVQYDMVLRGNNLTEKPKSSVADELERLHKLKESGAISDEEFNSLKSKVLSGS